LILCCIHTGLPSLSSSSFWLGSIGVSASLQPLIPVSLRRSMTHFCWDITIPFFERAISIPRKSLISISMAYGWLLDWKVSLLWEHLFLSKTKTTLSLYATCKNSICEYDFEIWKNSLFKRKLAFVMWNEHIFNLCPAEYAEDFLLCLFKVDCQAHQLALIDHPLIMNQEQEYHGEGVMFSVCVEAMPGPSNCYTFGEFFLQKKCVKLPLEIKWHLHPLHLLAKPPSHYSRCVCDKSFARHCCFCEFDDIKCALPPCIF